MPLPPLPEPVPAALRAARRRLLRHRRGLAALCAAGAVLAGLQSVAPPPAPTVTVLTAARDLPGGATLRADDVVPVEFAEGTAPSGGTTARRAVGRVLAAPLRRGEPVTDVRLVGPGLLEGHPGLVAAPVVLPDPAVVELLRVGDRVDLLVADPRSGRAERVVAAAPVIALPEPSDTGTAGAPGRVVLLGVPPSDADDVAAASVRGYLSVTLSG